ncbi:MAG TPA: hypothetical protein VMY79_02650 [Dehalococcoidia bacterium]|nr:hypothetical protein [Dehalococcoidia bacterium]
MKREVLICAILVREAKAEILSPETLIVAGATGAEVVNTVAKQRRQRWL